MTATEPITRDTVAACKCTVICIGTLTTGVLWSSPGWLQESGSGEIHLEGAKMRFTWTVQHKEKTERVPLFSCERVCEGKKHSKHDDCDASCDRKCDSAGGVHGWKLGLSDLNAIVDLAEEGNEPPKRPHILTMGDDFNRFGVAYQWSPTRAILNILDRI